MEIIEEIRDLKSSFSDKIINWIYTISEMFISVILTFIVDRSNNVYSATSKSEVYTEAIHLFPYIRNTIIVFLAFFIAVHIAVFIIRKISSLLYDNKRNYKNRKILKKYFYQKVINDITMALSLEKKAREIENNLNSSEQDFSVQNIYFLESYYYYELAIETMKDLNMFEISNKNRVHFTEFLLEMNPDFIIETFNTCEQSLNRMILLLSKNITNNRKKIIENMSLLCEKYHNKSLRIKEQLESSDNKKIKTKKKKKKNKDALI